VFFPMPEGRVVDESFGSRHRAALGITEETDAVVVIVSEERGTISFCFNGNIASNLDGAKLRTMLEAIFSPKVRRKSRKAAPKAARESSSGEAPLARRASDVQPARRTGDAPDSTRRRPIEPEHPRISLAEPDPSPVRPRVRPISDAPPPLRPSLTPPPPVVAPLRTPVTTSESRARPTHDSGSNEDPSDGGSRQSES
jgi:diadenylate cyclase